MMAMAEFMHLMAGALSVLADDFPTDGWRNVANTAYNYENLPRTEYADLSPMLERRCTLKVSLFQFSETELQTERKLRNPQECRL